MTLDVSKFQKRSFLLATFICLAPLSGCLSTPVSSMVKLSQFSPLEAVPGDMRFAVRSPEFLRVRDGDITFTLSFTDDDATNSFVETYKPVIDENAIPGQGISIGAQDGSRLAIAKFSDADAASMAAAQKRMKAIRAAGTKGKGSFAVAATGCATRDIPDGSILMTTWMRTALNEDYFIVFRNINLRDVLAKAGQSVDEIAQCN